jgi:hypothetical protein
MATYRNHDPSVRAETGAPTPYLTVGNSYVNAFTALATALFQTKHFYFSAATNDLSVQIQGSYDGGVTYITAVAPFAVAVATPVAQTITTPFTHIRVQVKPAVNDTHGTLTTNHFMGLPF